MRFLNGWTTAAAFALAGIGVDAEEAFARVNAGTLSCEIGKGFALILSKPRDLHCVFRKANGGSEAYEGKLREVGLNIGVSGRGVIAWRVIAPTANVPPGALGGRYGGVEAGAAAVLGARGVALAGGQNRSINLQPLTVEGEAGVNIAVGVASMSLSPLFRGRPSNSLPAVGLAYAPAEPQRRQVPAYGCGSYTHLESGQTLSGLARACGVTVQALLDANPNITNVRDIDAGSLVHLPDHTGQYAASPCGHRTVLKQGESIEQLAYRCGVTAHALLRENPMLREAYLIQPGLVLTIPDQSAPTSGPPVLYAATEEQLPAATASDAPPIYPIPGLAPREGSPGVQALSPGARARLEITCVNEAINRYGLSFDDVYATNSSYSSGDTVSVSLEARGRDGVCLVDQGGRVLFVTDLSDVRVAARPPAPVVPAQPVVAAGRYTETVRFGPGASSTTRRGSVSGDETINYVLGARAGQRMSVQFSPDNSSCYFNVLPPSGGNAIFIGSTSGNAFADRLPESGDYTVQAYLMRNAARRDETCRYAITFAVDGGGGSAAAAVAGAVIGGTLAAIASNRSSDNDRGDYVAEEDIFIVSLANPGSYLNVHNGPSSSAPVIGRFPNGATLGNAGGCQYPGGRQWCDVRASGGGLRGWVAGEFLAVPGPGGGATARAPARASSSDVSNAAQQACLSAVVNQTNERNVSILSTEFSQANSLVMVGVGANRAPWRCLVSNDGVVQEVYFTGDDSAGVGQSVAPMEDTATADDGGGAMAGSQSSSDVSEAAMQACLSAVVNQTNERNISILSTEFSEANSLVMVGVGANRAPWRCLVSNNGIVQEVMFTGDDSAGVDQSAPPMEDTAAADDGGGAMAGSQSSSDVSNAAIQACLNAIDNQTDGEVAVLSTEFSEANSLVMVGVGDQRAPWRCLVSNDGAVQEVMFAGSEGAL